MLKTRKEKIVLGRVHLLTVMFDAVAENYLVFNSTRSGNFSKLAEFYDLMRLPGVAKLYHLIRAYKHPFTFGEFKRLCKPVRFSKCAHDKPRLYILVIQNRT